MGVYLFNHQLLMDALTVAAKTTGETDFGKDILPKLIHQNRVMTYNFVDENRKLSVSWRDVGNIDSCWAANMDLVGIDPIFNLHDRACPLRTHQPSYPPAKFVFATISRPAAAARPSTPSFPPGRLSAEESYDEACSRPPST